MLNICQHFKALFHCSPSRSSFYFIFFYPFLPIESEAVELATWDVHPSEPSKEHWDAEVVVCGTQSGGQVKTRVK